MMKQTGKILLAVCAVCALLSANALAFTVVEGGAGRPSGRRGGSAPGRGSTGRGSGGRIDLGPSATDRLRGRDRGPRKR